MINNRTFENFIIIIGRLGTISLMAPHLLHGQRTQNWNVKKFDLKVKKFNLKEGRRVAQWVERRTFGSRGRGFESARGKICSALFFGAPVFELAFVANKERKALYWNTDPPSLFLQHVESSWPDVIERILVC